MPTKGDPGYDLSIAFFVSFQSLFRTSLPMSNSLTRNDPFAKMERYRGGVLMPIALFVVGAAATVWAAKTLTVLKQQDVKIQTIQAAAQFVERLKAMPADERDAFLRSLPRTDKNDNPIANPPNQVLPNQVLPSVVEPDAAEPTHQQLKKTE